SCSPTPMYPTRLSGYGRLPTEFRDVRFIPKSRLVQCTSACPLWANSGHQQMFQRCQKRTHRNDAPNCSKIGEQRELFLNSRNNRAASEIESARGLCEAQETVSWLIKKYSTISSRRIVSLSLVRATSRCESATPTTRWARSCCT